MNEKNNQNSDKFIKNNNSNKEKAKKLFMQALNHESDENFLKATKFYQEAVKLYPNILNTYINDNQETCSEKIDEREEVEQPEENSYLINILSKNFYTIIKFLDFYSMHRFLFLCKSISSLISLENEYKRLCYINLINCKEKCKLYGNSYKRFNELDRVIYNPCVVTYFRYLLFLNESNKVLIARSELNKKDVIEAFRITYRKVQNWDLSLKCDELIKHLIKFHNECENNLVKMIRIGEYNYNPNEKIIEIQYPELLNDPFKYKNIIKLRLQNYLGGNNNMLKWVSFKIVSKIKMDYSEDTLNIKNKQYKYNLKKKRKKKKEYLKKKI
ncbi:hypothetical protein PFMC_04116 [Plasmodium falciparum CAMP/Malaysia]|uniref:DNA replication origin binding protein n=1 Tax=Plasmodium falciparum (isolate Camp / Malaysia) TaxID=5835 RepID=A0A024X5A8_PLAFC|nr:hypothetical protein PFMC_04116 [Plasmodium falciparum CAMP/Malaysia]